MMMTRHARKSCSTGKVPRQRKHETVSKKYQADLGALRPEQRSAHVLEKRARWKRTTAPHVGATRHSDTDEDRTSWKQLYDESQRELHQLRVENEELSGAVEAVQDFIQELETQNADSTN